MIIPIVRDELSKCRPCNQYVFNEPQGCYACQLEGLALHVTYRADLAWHREQLRLERWRKLGACC